MVRVTTFIKSWPLSANLLLFGVTKWEAHIKWSCPVLMCDGHVEGKHSCDCCLVSWTSDSSSPTGQFVFERMTENYGYLDLSI